jgi:hypothetical protein
MDIKRTPRTLAYSFTFAFAGYLFGIQAHQGTAEVRTTRLIIVDSNGQEVATLGTGEGAVQLRLWRNNNAIEFSAAASGTRLSQKSQGYGSEHLTSNSSASYSLMRPNGTRVFCQAADNDAYISFKNEPSKRSAFLGAERNSASMRLFSEGYFSDMSTLDSRNSFVQDRRMPENLTPPTSNPK